MMKVHEISIVSAPASQPAAELSAFLPAPELPSEFKSGHPAIDAGHTHLLASISGLRRICIDHVALPDCTGCSLSTRKQCEEQLIAMLGDLLAFVLDHFRIEAEIMRDSLLLLVDRDVCEAHMEDHAVISGKVQEVVAALDPLNTVGLIRDLDALLAQWMQNHIALHDVMLARWVEREDSILRQRKVSAD